MHTCAACYRTVCLDVWRQLEGAAASTRRQRRQHSGTDAPQQPAPPRTARTASRAPRRPPWGASSARTAHRARRRCDPSPPQASHVAPGVQAREQLEMRLWAMVQATRCQTHAATYAAVHLDSIQHIERIPAAAKDREPAARRGDSAATVCVRCGSHLTDASDSNSTKANPREPPSSVWSHQPTHTRQRGREHRHRVPHARQQRSAYCRHSHVSHGADLGAQLF